MKVFITLGSNIAPAENLRWAAGLLHDQVGVKKTSHVYRSTPLGPDGKPLDQAGYLNAAVLVDVPDFVPPSEFKYRVLRAIEHSMGRTRTEDRYAARTIDLDLALYGKQVVDDEERGIHLPDPEIMTRAHVALPLADLAPEYPHPVTGEPLADIAARFAGTANINVTTLTLLE